MTITTKAAPEAGRQMPEILTVVHGHYHHYLRLHSYCGYEVTVLHPSEEPGDPGNGCENGPRTERPATLSFSRLNGRILSSVFGGMEGAYLAQDSLKAVHPATFRAAAVGA